MATYQVVYNSTTKTVKIQPDGSTPGAGFTDIGSFDHDADPEDELGPDINHVYYHHVQDLLYAVGVTDMQSIKIRIPIITITSLPATVSIDLSNAETAQITNTFAPTNARDTRVSYTSSDPTKATVNSTGKITPVAIGTSTITVAALDGSGATDTVAVTVVA